MSKVAILGASAGLGAALACHHARAGDEVIAIARRGTRLTELARALGVAGSERWQQETLDLTQPADLDRLLLLLGTRAPISALYFVAASNEVQRHGSPSDRLAMIESYNRLLFAGWVSIAEAAEEENVLAPGATVVTISSIAAAVPFSGLELYGAGKAALEMWARATRGAPAARRVVVRPGRFDSDFFSPSDLDLARLPHTLAARIVDDIQAGHEEIHLGSRRDRFASRLGLTAQRLATRYVRDASPGRSDQ